MTTATQPREASGWTALLVILAVATVFMVGGSLFDQITTERAQDRLSALRMCAADPACRMTTDDFHDYIELSRKHGS